MLYAIARLIAQSRDLAVNVNTAKALGIKTPNSNLVRTDKVIE